MKKKIKINICFKKVFAYFFFPIPKQGRVFTYDPIFSSFEINTLKIIFFILVNIIFVLLFIIHGSNGKSLTDTPRTKSKN